MTRGSSRLYSVQIGNTPKHPVLFELDETALLGHMTSINDAVGIGRAYGIRLRFYFQSMGQLKRICREGEDHTLLSNTTQVFFGVNDNTTADYVSARLGDETVVVSSGGSGTSRSYQQTHGMQASHSESWSSNESHNWNQQARRLLKPEEVIALSPRTAITFTAGLPPICTELIRYYEEPDLARLSRRSSVRAVLAWTLLLIAIVTCATSAFLATTMTVAARQALSQ